VMVAGAVWLAPAAQAQVSTTGPAGLAQQMPRIYALYLANIGRGRVLDPRKPGASEIDGVNGSGRRPVVTTTFRPVGPAFVPKRLAAQLAKTQDRRAIEATLAKCLSYYAETARRKNVPLHDVARSLAYFIATNYFVYAEGKAGLPPMQATQERLRANMIEDATFRQMTDRQKQEAYETLIVLAGFADLGYGTMRQAGDDAGAAAFRSFARQNLENLLGAPVEKMHFTEEGLRLD
jgi:hypothetical protein